MRKAEWEFGLGRVKSVSAKAGLAGMEGRREQNFSKEKLSQGSLRTQRKTKTSVISVRGG